MANPVPQFTKDDLTSVQSMASHIIAAAARYGVPPEVIAGSLAVEQFDQKASLWKRSKAILSALDADGFLGLVHAGGYATDSVNYERGASDIISDLYSASPNAITVGQDSVKKLFNPLLVDYGPAGVKFHNAIQAILNNPDDPAFAPYVNNLYSAGDALQKGSDPKLTAAAMAAYLQQGIRIYQANMSVNGDPQTGINAWNNLSPSLRNALLVQFYKQGPTPDRVLRSMTDAAQRGVPYVPQIGADGAGATYAANESAIAQALDGAPADFSSRWDALGPSKPATTGAPQSNSSAPPGAAPDSPAAPAPTSGSDAPLGIFSGKPMRFFGAPIFDTQRPSTALDDLIWNGTTLRTPPRDAGAAAPLAPNDQNPFDVGNSNASTSGPGNAAVPSTSQASQGPLSLNDAYLEYLKRLNAAQAQ